MCLNGKQMVYQITKILQVTSAKKRRVATDKTHSEKTSFN
jgi:hypothetical protein